MKDWKKLPKLLKWLPEKIIVVLCGCIYCCNSYNSTLHSIFLYKNEVAERGTHLAVVLPDGSKVDLNAESKIGYKPLWWFISRDVELKGEAYLKLKRKHI